MKHFFFLVTFCCSFLLHSQENFSIGNIPSELTKNANSVILQEKTEVDVSVHGQLNHKEYKVIAVLNEIGKKNVSAYVRYDDDTKIKKLEAYVYDAFGNEIKHFKKRDFKDVSSVDGFSIFIDDRIVYLDYIPTSYPFIVKFISEIENSTTAFIPSWYPLDGFARSTQNSEYVLRFNPSNKPRFLIENTDGLDISITENASEIICKASNVNSFKYEKLALPFSKIVPNISFALNNFTLKGVQGSASNWEEFGAWMESSLLNDVDDIPESTLIVIRNLTKNAKTKEEKARIVYDYLQQKVRYISVQIGIGGWKPMLASEVDKLSYGDCKALSNYTKTLLKSIGIDSYYTILYAGEIEKDLNKDFSRLQGNHAIIGLPEGDGITWLECTSQNTPFGYIGDFCDDREVLIVTPNGGKIVRTKKYGHKDNVQESNVKIEIKENRSALVNYKSIYKGLQYGEQFRLTLKNEEEINDYYKSKWSKINGYHVENITINNNRDSIVFQEQLIVKIPKVGSKIGNDLLLSLNNFNASTFVPTRNTDRKRELYISEEFEDNDFVEIVIPEHFEIGELPKNKIIENEFGYYSMIVNKISDSKIEYFRTFILKKGIYPKEKYKEYRAFRKEVAKLDKTKIVLKTIV